MPMNLSNTILFGILTYSLISQSYEKILRLKCGTYANFTVERSNTKLLSTFLTLVGVDKLECQSECIIYKQCKTININQADLVCELNDKSTEDRRDNVNAIAAPGWTYFATRYDETLIGRRCIEENPCKNTTICYDTCACPGYQCVGMRSCQDLYLAGKKKTGVYEIIDNNDNPLNVICDFESEANTIWTLITSFSLQNKAYFSSPLYKDSPRMEATPNWMDYRLGLSRIMHIRSLATMWRATCSFPTYQSNIYRDYVRGKAGVDDFVNYAGEGRCLNIDFINIRGHEEFNTTVPFWQTDVYHFHTDSTIKLCQFDSRQDSVASEDNFGFYYAPNTAFRCTESQESTTQYWFGNAV